MNILAPGKWTINENGELEPDDNKAKNFSETGGRQKAHQAAGENPATVYYCLHER